jgi:hypothetical protein
MPSQIRVKLLNLIPYSEVRVDRHIFDRGRQKAAKKSDLEVDERKRWRQRTMQEQLLLTRRAQSRSKGCIGHLNMVGDGRGKGDN